LSELFVVTAAAFQCVVAPFRATACPYSIRDVGFVELAEIPYRLYFFLQDATAGKEDFQAAFERASGAILADSNVEAEIVNVDQQKTHPAVEYLRFWEMESFPAALLVSPRGHSMVVPIFEASRPFVETAWSALETIVSSPAREEIMEKIVTAWGVVILVEGKNAAANGTARKVVAEAIADIARSMNRAGRTVEEAPHLLVLSADLYAREEVLLWSVGLEHRGSRGPHVALLYGKGRQFGPVLEGDALSRQSLFSLLDTLGMKCGCDADPGWLSSAVIPHRWGQKLRGEVVKNLGFDPDNPMVKMEVSSVWRGIGEREADASGIFAYSEGEMGGQEEGRQVASGRSEKSQTEAAGPGTRRSGAVRRAQEAGPTLEEHVWRAAILMAITTVLILLAGSAFIFSRWRRKKRSL